MSRATRQIVVRITSVLLLAATVKGSFALAAGPGDGIIQINYDKPRQVIDGFGFSTAWGNLPGSPANEDAFFNQSTGAGFSILRNRIPFRENPQNHDHFLVTEDGHYVFTTVNDAKGTRKNFRLDWNNWDLATTRDLIKRVQANPQDQLTRVFSTPWTPPNNAVERWKHTTDPSSRAKHRLTENSYSTTPEVGGYLKPEHYQDYADLLADYVLGFEEHMGIELYALSLQNEPNWDCDYESCDWSAQQLHDFMLVVNDEFTRKGVWAAYPNLKIMAPEDNNFRDSLLSVVYRDPATRNLLGIAAGHQYEYGQWAMGGVANIFTPRDKYRPDPFARSFQYGKPVWMTEWSTGEFESTTPIRQALVLARIIHMDFVQSHLDAFVYWWSVALLEGNNPNKPPKKTLWGLAQYSRFVRPGWKMVAATESPISGVYVTAFADAPTNHTSIVLINTNNKPKSIALHIAGISAIQKLDLYRTSDTENMAQIGPIAATGPNANVPLPPASISTCYGEVSP